MTTDSRPAVTGGIRITPSPSYGTTNLYADHKSSVTTETQCNTDYGIDYKGRAVLVVYDKQSNDIAQGLMFGYASRVRHHIARADIQAFAGR